MRPPAECITRSPGKALFDTGEVAARGGLEEGVDGGGAGALILAVFGKHLVRGADGEARRAQCFRQPGLVLGAQVREEEADCHCLRSHRAGLLDHPSGLGVVEGRYDLAAGANALTDGDDVAASATT